MKIKFKTLILFLIVILIIVYASMYITIKNSVYASNLEENIIENKKCYKNEEVEELNIEKIIKENQEKTMQEIIIEEEEIEYNTIYKESNNIAKGSIQVLRQGQNGIKQLIIKKQNDDEENKEILATKIIKAQVNKIVEIGTSQNYISQEIKQGEEVYVYSDVLDLMKEPNINSQKIIKLAKGDKAKVIQIQDNWCEIEYKNYTGWVEKTCLINQEEIVIEKESSNKNITNLNFNMNLAKPSGLTQAQFENILSNNSKDKNNILAKYAKYFYYAEKQYGINGVFLAAVAIHESSWGTSKIALEKNNLFGYGAYDNSAYESANKFSSYEEGIDLLARVFMKYYLNPKGTSIYEGQVADGRYYNGNTLNAVNKKYASDSNWANAVYEWMGYLYERI